MMNSPSSACSAIRRSRCRSEMGFGSTPFSMKETMASDNAKPAKAPSGTPMAAQPTNQIWQTQPNSGTDACAFPIA